MCYEWGKQRNEAWEMGNVCGVPLSLFNLQYFVWTGPTLPWITSSMTTQMLHFVFRPVSQIKIEGSHSFVISVMLKKTNKQKQLFKCFTVLKLYLDFFFSLPSWSSYIRTNAGINGNKMLCQYKSLPQSSLKDCTGSASSNERTLMEVIRKQ